MLGNHNCRSYSNSIVPTAVSRPSQVAISEFRPVVEVPEGKQSHIVIAVEIFV